jgi:phosphorylated CTD-interacting factor 1
MHGVKVGCRPVVDDVHDKLWRIDMGDKQWKLYEPPASLPWSSCVPSACPEIPQHHLLRLVQLEQVRAECFAKMEREFNSIIDSSGYSLSGAFGRWFFTQLALNDSPEPLMLLLVSHKELRLETELRVAGACEKSAQELCSQVASAAQLISAEFLVEKESLLAAEPKDSSVFVETSSDRDQISLRFCSKIFKLNRFHYDRLRTLYFKYTSGDVSSESFHFRLFLLLMRYESFGGDAFQAAIPKHVFQYLSKEIGVTTECFASPLNSFCPQFCSAFYDTDRFFGSLGSFFNFFPEEGCYEANPPFVEVSMQKMAEHMDLLLFRSCKPLCFVVIVPKWCDDECTMWAILSNSRFLVTRFDIPKRSHHFHYGYQHKLSKQFWMAGHVTTVFVLQNEQGKKRFPVKANFTKGLLEEWKMEKVSKSQVGSKKRERSW